MFQQRCEDRREENAQDERASGEKKKEGDGMEKEEILAIAVIP